eukprot:NODE_581_length_864_cov_4.541104_g442_i0.p5 GENE.NODE_581_length_864_cov_4.541104_g442_i0~~NODE_581_length_864_cov_4.541104_g442_i0.p5  ORF type:complete len:56 (-),score=1.49 NODE_581_length_864_cov_4.541104_g442_i0:430-597(-)
MAILGAFGGILANYGTFGDFEAFSRYPLERPKGSKAHQPNLYTLNLAQNGLTEGT